MNHLNIKVPESRITQDWINFINVYIEEDYTCNELIVDFHSLTFADTDDLVILACLIESLHSKGANVKIIGGSKKLSAHLKSIHFTQYWNENFERNNFTISRDRKSICLWHITKPYIESYTSFVKEYFKRTYLNNKDLIPLSSNLLEAFNNIFDHSQSGISGFVITQYYPNTKRISFSICDLGVGIPHKVNEYRKNKKKKILSDNDAISRALDLGFTTESTPQNKGFGLNNILEMINSSDGLLMIVSNKGAIHIENKKSLNIEIDVNLHGTLIKVEVDADYFDLFDESEEIYEFELY